MTVPEYEQIERLRMRYVDQSTLEVDKSGPRGHYDAVYEGQGRLVLDGIDNWERRYRLS